MKQNEELILTSQQQEYLDWLCTAPSERVPATKTLFAESIGLGRKTLHRWEKKDIFVSEWRKSVDEVQGSPERTQRLLDTLYNKALDGDINAGKLYLQATNRMAPPSVTISSDKKTVDLTDAELDSLIASIAGREKANRNHLKAVV